ncbi:hypothetical protein EP073_02880 [Geovibrio thiophilus]|uniref:Pilus assembly protein PilP n=1 Tax=Geovibrio thiophilus TaxID=139438 RepID=A0A410JWE6_9BACT|nr:hypothetical protein [Geovibrio thiophilus]QAR32379.1 hypothetical protein EP073_02880 [Geovibrio thiophilus]
MKKLTLLFTAVFLFGCTEIDREELMKNRAEVKPVKPIEVNFERLEKQKEELIELFSTVYVAPEYAFTKDPFTSVVDIYKLAQAEEEATLNPVLIHKFDEFKLVGILTGEIGNIAVLAVADDSFYLKTGDVFSANRSTIIFIGQDLIKVRDNSKDIFGNTKTEIKDIKLDYLKDDSSKEKTS